MLKYFFRTGYASFWLQNFQNISKIARQGIDIFSIRFRSSPNRRAGFIGGYAYSSLKTWFKFLKVLKVLEALKDKSDEAKKYSTNTTSKMWSLD